MAPKFKITKEEIVEASLDLIRWEGRGALNARSIASSLGCSTQPIFSNFSNMAELDLAVRAEAYSRYLVFTKEVVESNEYPLYKAAGMAYIRFAAEEKELFKLLFMCDRTGEDLTPTADFESTVDMIASSNGISREKASLLHLEMWIVVHGIATMQATSFLPLEWELISNVLTDVYLGVRERILKEK